MMPRSNGGCLDCRHAKIKCDEAHPSCGTCARRRYTCQGYPRTRPKRRPNSEAKQRAAFAGLPKWKRTSSVLALAPAPHGDDIAVSSPTEMAPWPAVGGYPTALTLRHLPDIPPGIIRAGDHVSVELFFTRHTHEFTLGSEFVNEMNARLLKLLQGNANAMMESIYAIGQCYMSVNNQGSLMIPIIDRKTRMLTTLRSLNHSDHNLVLVLAVMLGLCVTELLDSESKPHQTSLPALIANSAMMIKNHIDAGYELDSGAKYYIRSLARQDMVISLTSGRQPLIPTSIWLDDECRKSADRSLGYTVSMMPLFTDLCALAEKLRGYTAKATIEDATIANEGTISVISSRYNRYNDLSWRAAELRAQFQAWRPTYMENISFRTSRNLLSHAYSYRSAALLYLHRLLHPAGSSAAEDAVALSMAHDVMVYTTGPPEDIRWALWPLFIASCELSHEDDRSAAVKSFDAVISGRQSATAIRVKKFCIERVWAARDAGQNWFWMDLAASYPGECMPI